VQIGGIRQIYDEPVAATAENWAAGVDWKIPKETYLGTELRYTNRRTPLATSDLVFAFAPGSDEVNPKIRTSSDPLYGHDHTVSSYWHQVLTPELVSSVTHDWSNTETDLFDQGVRTHRLRFRATYFRPDGLYAFSSATWRYQTRDNIVDDEDPTADFWNLSGGVGYQFEHRHGFVQLAVTNILDQDYRYINTAFDDGLRPGIGGILSLHLNF
jgi:hypothetical protein